MTSQNFKQRIAVSGLAILGLILAMFFASFALLEPLFVAIIAGVIGFALQEFYQLAQKKGASPASTAGIFCSTIYVFAVYLSTQAIVWSLLPHLVFALSLVSLFFHFFYKGEKPLINLPVTVFGLVWITLTLAGLVQITFFFPESIPEDGRWWFFYLLFLTKVTDAGAYFTGKQFGKRRLAPGLSPGKTIEGAIGGTITALVASLLFQFYANDGSITTPFSLTVGEAVGLGLLLPFFGQIGDLAESLLKRDAGVKDSNVLPGLGGVLDVVDSLLFTTPILTLFLMIR